MKSENRILNLRLFVIFGCFEAREAFPMTKAILVVDDNPDIRLAVCELFKREAGFEVCEEALDGRDLIEKAQRQIPIDDLGFVHARNEWYSQLICLKT